MRQTPPCVVFHLLLQHQRSRLRTPREAETRGAAALYARQLAAKSTALTAVAPLDAKFWMAIPPQWVGNARLSMRCWRPGALLRRRPCAILRRPPKGLSASPLRCCFPCHLQRPRGLDLRPQLQHQQQQPQMSSPPGPRPRRRRRCPRRPLRRALRASGGTTVPTLRGARTGRRAGVAAAAGRAALTRPPARARSWWLRRWAAICHTAAARAACGRCPSCARWRTKTRTTLRMSCCRDAVRPTTRVGTCSTCPCSLGTS